jgi:CRISPR/Cas system-associated endonuclease Cas1
LRHVSDFMTFCVLCLPFYFSLLPRIIEGIPKFKHPVLQTQCTYQEAFEIQARLLAKYLMGQIDQYPPLVLK